MIEFTALRLKELAEILANIDRADLEACDIVRPGSAGDDQWSKFNSRSLDTFIIKLNAAQLHNLWEMIARRMAPAKEPHHG